MTPAEPRAEVTVVHEPRHGLSTSEAAHRLEVHGPNEIRHEAATSWWRLLFEQFRSALVLLLLAACVLAATLGEVADAIAIAAIVVVNSLVGFFQEFRAERAILALKAMTAPRARVVRDGRSAMVAAADVVPGDLLVLEAGDLVAADAKLLEASRLQTNEAPLTGESTPVEKSTAPSAPGAPLAERRDIVFLGTAVSTGTGLAEVLATGMKTELGRIATLLAGVKDEATPLQKRLARVGRMLLWLCLGVVAIVALVGIAHGGTWIEVLLSSVSIAVAAVPEGLPAVVTIALAVGVQRMAERNVLIRRLASVETLGSATVVCTDKTGTLTTGVMTVREIWGPDHRGVLFAAAACTDAELSAGNREGVGDPTEIAILVAAAARGIHRADIERERPRVAELPFDSDRKRMSVHRSDDVLYVKGAPESVIPLCVSGTDGALEEAADLAARGLRVLAVAVGAGGSEARLRLQGLVGIADPPRSEAVAAVAAARRAGVGTVMITGDHPATARAIAIEMGILGPDDDPNEVVHARATPEDKIDIVRDWKARGAVVAMTGDGVNDAPALREADIGIAMGKAGTEVAREASDMVLADDDFASIVAAIREGRGVYENIRKTLVYLLSGNVAELIVVLGASVVGAPLPLLPIQLLWINLVTDGLPALALAMDPAPHDALAHPPRPVDEPILGRSEWIRVLAIASVESAVVLGAFAWNLATRGIDAARYAAFSVLVFSELFRAFSARSARETFWEVGAFTNLKLLAIVAFSVVLQVGVHHIPFAQRLFHVQGVTLVDCAVGMALGLVPVTVVELAKIVRRLTSRAT